MQKLDLKATENYNHYSRTEKAAISYRARMIQSST